MTSAFPLKWPVGRPRRAAGQRRDGKFVTVTNNGRFTEKKPVTVAGALERLQAELDRIGARYPVISSNLEPRLDGLPRSGQPEPGDPGIALYFDLKGKQHCMPCDTYTRAAQNIAAIAAHIEATRAIERHGVSTVAEMFAGFTALPPPGPNWREIFGYGPNTIVDRDLLAADYRELAKKCGNEAALRDLNVARDAALKEIGQ